MNTIEIKDNVFLLSTRNTSYFFYVNQYKHLEHLHYGCQVRMQDGEELALKRCLAYGSTILYKEDSSYSLDQVAQEYGTYGRGDFKEASIELEADGSYTTEFLFDSYEIKDGEVRIPGLPSAYGADKTLIVHLKDEARKLQLDLYYTIYPEEDVITRRAVLINQSSRKYLLHKLMSFCLDLYEDGLQMMDFCGAWDKETHVNLRDIKRGTCSIGSRVGFSSAKQNPGFIVKRKDTNENYGKAWGFNLVYTGNHYSSVSKDEYGIHRIQSGISPERFVYELKKGASFETPEAVMTFSDKGLNNLSHHFHDFINGHIVRSDWKEKERPVLINSWEAFGMDFNKNKLVKLAKQGLSLGMELFVLDDGWFGRRSDDTKGLGDYDCNTKKIPGGIRSLSKEIHDLGMLFGIWVEPECINVDSKLYEKHPEYAIAEKDREMLFGRHQLLMDLTNPEVRDYIVQNVSDLIDKNKVDYIKWDMNRMMDGVSGAYSHEYIKGLYEVLDRVFTPRPHVLFESCSSGGNRFDLGMLCFSPQVWASDDTDPIERIDIQKGLSYLYPLSTVGAHVSASPHLQTLRQTPLETRFTISAYGCLGYELDLNLLSPVEKKEIKKQIAYYKKHRKTFQYGRFYRINEEEQYEQFEVSADETIVSKFRRIVHAAPIYDKLYALGLNDEEMYEIVSRPYLHNIRQFGNLINFILPVKIDANGHLMNEIGKRRGMDAAGQNYRASGAALRSGIYLNNLFLGSGFNDSLRIPLDYGSDMYEIKEMKQ